MDKVKARGEIGEWLKALVFAIIIALLVRAFVFEIARVEGPSMQPTLHTDQRVYVDKLTYKFRAPRRGEIIVCFYDEYSGHSWKGPTYIKRVIGLPGETIAIKDGQIYINNKLYDDPYYDGRMPFDIEAKKIPADSVFVMGDNRENSRDSTDLETVGPIERKFIIGRAVYRVWPMKDISKIK